MPSLVGLVGVREKAPALFASLLAIGDCSSNPDVAKQVREVKLPLEILVTPGFGHFKKPIDTLKTASDELVLNYPEFMAADSISNLVQNVVEGGNSVSDLEKSWAELPEEVRRSRVFVRLELCDITKKILELAGPKVDEVSSQLTVFTSALTNLVQNSTNCDEKLGAYILSGLQTCVASMEEQLGEESIPEVIGGVFSFMLKSSILPKGSYASWHAPADDALDEPFGRAWALQATHQA
jgi:hypothetical protein